MMILAVLILTVSCAIFAGGVVFLIRTLRRDKRIEDAHQRQREWQNDRIMAMAEFRAKIATGEITEGVHFLPGVGFVEVKTGQDETRGNG